MDLFGRFLRLLALAAGYILIALMLVTVLDVVMRYVFNRPLASSWEFTEFSMALIVFLAIAYCGWTGGHISVDLFEKWLDRPALRLLPALLAFVSAGLFIVIAYRAGLEASATFGQVSNMLRWPHFPFRFAVAFGAAMYAIVLIIQGLRSLRGAAAEGRK